MEAAFVDIGLAKNGFLYVNEIVLPELDERERRKKRIQELIQPGQDVLVQVTKDPMGTKGARLTMEVSLAGPLHGAGARRRRRRRLAASSPDAERDRLRDLIRKIQTHEDAGLIVRTAAEGATLDELERDVRLLEKLWEVTRGHAERAEAPALVYAEPDLSLQMIRDDLRADVSEVVVDDERQYHRILAYVSRTSPELAERIKLYRGKRAALPALRDRAGHPLDALRRRVDLPSGGSLIFDYAEAFTIVDVNTGRFTGKTAARGHDPQEQPRGRGRGRAPAAAARHRRHHHHRLHRHGDARRTATPCSRRSESAREGPHQGYGRDLAARPGRDDPPERRRRRARDPDRATCPTCEGPGACSRTSRS